MRELEVYMQYTELQLITLGEIQKLYSLLEVEEDIHECVRLSTRIAQLSVALSSSLCYSVYGKAA